MWVVGEGETSLDPLWHASLWCKSSEHGGTSLIIAHECWTSNTITYSAFVPYSITQTRHRARGRGVKSQQRSVFNQRGGAAQSHCSGRLGTKTFSWRLLPCPSGLSRSPTTAIRHWQRIYPRTWLRRGTFLPLKWKLKSLQNKCSDSAGCKGLV